MAGRRPPGALLLRPAALLALLALALNDHLLKGAAAGWDATYPAAAALGRWLTGKVSDVAGMYLFPLVLAALGEAAARVSGWAPRRRTLAWMASGSTAAIFAAVKVWPGANAALARMVGPMALDATDLLALPMTLLAAREIALGSPAPGQLAETSPAARVTRLAAICVATLVCAATTQAPPNYPSWQALGPDEHRIGCARVEAWVSKSGKEGFGVTVDLRSVAGDGGCHVELTQASFRDAAGTLTEAALPPPLDACGDVRTHAYLPFAFDNQALWNRSLQNPAFRSGVLVLGIRAGVDPIRLVTIPLQQPEVAKHGQWPKPRHPLSSPFERATHEAAPRDAPAPLSSGDRSPRYGGTCWPE